MGSDMHNSFKLRTDSCLADLIATFSGPSSSYYQARLPVFFGKPGPSIQLNKAALLGGPLWGAGRGLFGAVLLLAVIELALVAIITTGATGNAGRLEMVRAAELLSRSETRGAQAKEAESSGAENAKEMRAAADAIALSAKSAAANAAAQSEQARMFAVAGVGIWLLVRVIFACLANPLYARRFEQWRGDRSIRSGRSWLTGLACGAALLVLYVLVALQFGLETSPAWLTTTSGPTPASVWWGGRLDNVFHYLTRVGEPFFDIVSAVIGSLVAALEAVLSQSPWPVTAVVITALALLLAGSRVAIFTAVGLSYLVIFGFWEKSMSTIALLGTATLLSLSIGLPLGIVCGKRSAVYSICRPVLDLMQTMPAFVYLIPIIAFFGTGKTPGILATIIFGMPPVARLTALGLQQVPASVSEACAAFGASEWQTLWKADLPIAVPSIKAGINQTILLCLSMVVIASLIGAGGLGENVLESLQYASTGQGILVGLAILFCAIILDRVVQGRNTKEQT